MTGKFPVPPGFHKDACVVLIHRGRYGGSGKIEEVADGKVRATFSKQLTAHFVPGPESQGDGRLFMDQGGLTDPTDSSVVMVLQNSEAHRDLVAADNKRAASQNLRSAALQVSWNADILLEDAKELQSALDEWLRYSEEPSTAEKESQQ